MDNTDLTLEQRQKARDCKTAEDVLALAKEEGYELSDEQLESLAGGEFWNFSGCSYYGVE